MAGSLPPSSSVTRLRSGAADRATFLPVSTEPVKLILRGTGCVVMKAPRSSPPLTMLTTPGGKTSRSSSPTLSVVSGVNGDGLSTKRVAGQQRRGDLPEGQGQREVPRRDGGHDAERPPGQLHVGRVVVLNDLRRHVEVGEVLAPDGRGEDLDPGVAERLALLGGEHRRQLGRRRHQHVGGPQQGGPPGRLVRLPVAGRLGRGVERGIELLAGALGRLRRRPRPWPGCGPRTCPRSERPPRRWS